MFKLIQAIFLSEFTIYSFTFTLRVLRFWSTDSRCRSCLYLFSIVFALDFLYLFRRFTIFTILIIWYVFFHQSTECLFLFCRFHLTLHWNPYIFSSDILSTFNKSSKIMSPPHLQSLSVDATYVCMHSCIAQFFDYFSFSFSFFITIIISLSHFGHRPRIVFKIKLQKKERYNVWKRLYIFVVVVCARANELKNSGVQMKMMKKKKKYNKKKLKWKCFASNTNLTVSYHDFHIC